jgi:hypothetical protein
MSERTAWNAAVSQLFQAMKVTIYDLRDPRERRAREYDLRQGPSRDELALRAHLENVRFDGVRETGLISAELARLDGEQFGRRLAEVLQSDFPEDTRDAVEAIAIELQEQGHLNALADTKPSTEQRALSDTERGILKHCRKKAHKGERIANHVGLSYDHVRRVLAGLVKGGRLRKTADGYRTV